MPSRKRTCSIISLGCPKNLIDSENMIGRLLEHHFELKTDVKNVDVVLLNTCGFIQSARNEAFGYLENLIRCKKAGQIRFLIVTGCMVSVEGAALTERYPEVDAWLSPFDESQIVPVVSML
ncbi:MAG: 30S ribosomal protein S12 methylthiotransferase RimO, partial [Thermoguttaceae bacterium]|nr:30S ribosomal protein S12 methylthiotransferase RimO [Thermoguttaceae bacterium]